MAKKAAAPKKESEKMADSTTPPSGELENLREILFGNQARATDDRLNQLEENLQTVHRNFTDALNRQNTALREATATVEKELKKQMSDQAKLNQSDHQALAESINELRSETKRQIDEVQTTFSQELEALRSSLTDHIRRMQNESRQRDDDLRQELLTVSNWLDNKLTPRHDLGQLLVELGHHLQNNASKEADNTPDH